MKHYTQTIPFSLAEKLKEKGMPILIEQEWYPNGMPKAEKDCHKPMTKYCEVFDWLMERGKEIEIFYVPARGVYMYGIAPSPDYQIGGNTWHEAANAAIEKALELI